MHIRHTKYKKEDYESISNREKIKKLQRLVIHDFTWLMVYFINIIIKNFKIMYI